MFKRILSGGVLFGLAAFGAFSGSPVQGQKTPDIATEATRKSDEHVSEFLEDPFVTKYRKKFFAVFAGKTGEFEQGMSELDALLAKNPKDARALVWHGNGLMVRAGLLRFKGKSEEGHKVLLNSKIELDKAVALDPDNVNILAMRAVTLHIAGQYWPEKELPAGTWTTIIHDLEKSRKIINPERMKKISVHARGEILSELANAYGKAGNREKSRGLWEEVKQVVPGSKYAVQAEAALQAEDKKPTAQ